MIQQELITESRETTALLRDYFSGNNTLSLRQFETLLDKGQDLRDQLEDAIFTLRDQEELNHG